MSEVSFKTLEGPDAEKLKSMFGYDFISVSPGNVILSDIYKLIGERIQEFDVRSDDVWIPSYPRTGSNWVAEIVWCIVNDLDFETANDVIHGYRAPRVEVVTYLKNMKDTSYFNENLYKMIDHAANLKPPRVIKTHLSMKLLPKKLPKVHPKIIYVSRNPKDVCVSYYHFSRTFEGIRGTLEDFTDLFLRGKVPVGGYWDHVLSYWCHKDENILFIKYEEIRKDLQGWISKISKFLGKDLSTDDIRRLMDHVSFEKMKNNPSINHVHVLKHLNGPEFKPVDDQSFIRKGKIGGWKGYLTKELSEKIDQWTEENLKGTGLSYSEE